MDKNKMLDVKDVFFEALKYPQFARANFYIINQKNSGWERGPYLIALSEVYHMAIQSLQIKFSFTKKKFEEVKFETFKISLRELVKIDNDTIVDKNKLDELFYAIQYAWRFDDMPKTYTPYQIISFAEKTLVFIRKEFYEQIKRTSDPMPRPRTKTYFTYLIASDGPFLNFPVFKNAVRELLFTSANLKKAEKILTAYHTIAIELVKIWNEKLYFIEERAHNNDENATSERVRVEFHADTLRTSWWSDEKLFDNLPHDYFSNQSLATYASQIANLINSDILHGQEVNIKLIRKNFLEDLISGIEHAFKQNESNQAIKNILEGNNKEEPFTVFFDGWLSAKGYNTHRESLRGNNHIDLKADHVSTTTKIIEFKGWWNDYKSDTVIQLFNYLTPFNGEGYIFMINHTSKNIENEYQNIIVNEMNGYIENSWKKIRYKRTPFYYFISTHEIDDRQKIIYHFIFDIQKPRKIRQKKSKEII